MFGSRGRTIRGAGRPSCGISGRLPRSASASLGVGVSVWRVGGGQVVAVIVYLLRGRNSATETRHGRAEVQIHAAGDRARMRVVKHSGVDNTTRYRGRS